MKKRILTTNRPSVFDTSNKRSGSLGERTSATNDRSSALGGWLGLRGRASTQAMAETTRSLAVLVEARMPLVRALRAVTNQCEDRKLEAVLDEVCGEVKAGRSLSDGLAQHPDVFDNLYVHLVRVGEKIGSLGPVLRRMADYLERMHALQRKVRLALVYPSMIVVIAIGAVGFMLTVIVPTFADMFEGFGAELPAATQRVIQASDVLTSNFVLTIGGLVLCVIGVRWVVNTPRGRTAWDAVKLRLPFVGPMLRKGLAARFCRTLGTLLERGVPLTGALHLLVQAVDNVVAREELRTIGHAVERGDALSEQLSEATVFPPLVSQMILVGEETARLDETLLHVATLYEEELDGKVETLTSVIEPVLIVVIGVLLGLILIALYLPLFDLVTVVG